MSETIKKPEGLIEEHLLYLDNLRESGVTNMFGARPYLEDRFAIDKKTASSYLSYWMKTFGKENRIKI